MWPLLPPPAAPHPARRPGPPTAGSPLGPLPAGAHRPLHGHPPAAARVARPPGSLPRRRFRSKTRPGRELSEVLSLGRSPPPLAARPPRPVTSKPSSPAPWQAGDQSAEGAGFGGGGEGTGASRIAERVPGRGSDWKEKRGLLACPPPPGSEPRTPRLASLRPDASTPLFLTSDQWCLSQMSSHFSSPLSRPPPPTRCLSAFPVRPDQVCVQRPWRPRSSRKLRICLPPGLVRLRQPAESTAVGWGMGIQKEP